MKPSRKATVLLVLVAVACATAPRPRVMNDVDKVRKTPAVALAKTYAPQALARAEAFRFRAHEAHDAGNRAAAQVLSETALAGYSRAFVLARLARAEARLAKTEGKLAKTQKELAALDDLQLRTQAEANNLELKIRIVSDTIPLSPNVATGPKRERARREAARALAAQADLLCQATRMLKKDAAGDTLKAVESLRQQLEKKPKVTPIDEAIRLRTECLRQLSKARRKVSTKGPAEGAADALLEALSRAGDLYPFRDDRGVVVVLGNLDENTMENDERLRRLGRAAKAHPSFPVLVVGHGKGAKLAESAAAVLRRVGAPKVEHTHAGNALPQGKRHRVEIVFVSPDP